MKGTIFSNEGHDMPHSLYCIDNTTSRPVHGSCEFHNDSDDGSENCESNQSSARTAIRAKVMSSPPMHQSLIQLRHQQRREESELHRDSPSGAQGCCGSMHNEQHTPPPPALSRPPSCTTHPLFEPPSPAEAAAVLTAAAAAAAADPFHDDWPHW